METETEKKELENCHEELREKMRKHPNIRCFLFHKDTTIKELFEQLFECRTTK